MSLKGSFKVGRLIAPEAYAVVDNITASKGGSAHAHVSVYATPPEDQKVERVKLVDGVEATYEETVRDRGPVLDHFTISGIDLSKSTNIFQDTYAQIKADERLSSMVDA